MAHNTDGRAVARLSWAGKQVRIEEVETSLSTLWKMSADNLRTAANLHVRTSVLNLVICAPDIASARYASTLLRHLASTHLARVTLAILDTAPDAPDMLASWVTLRCFSMISDLMRHCFEQTTLLASGRAGHLLTEALPRVLKEQLPTYLWWIGDTNGADETIFQRVAELCQRVIVDSATFQRPEQDIHALATYCKHAPQIALSDLNWGRLTPWRQLVAQFFDVPEYLPFLHGIERIEIEHAVAPPHTEQANENGQAALHPTSALLLAGWLKTSLTLALIPTSAQHLHDTHTGTYQWALQVPAGGTPALLHIRPRVQPDVQPGALCLVRLTCTVGNTRAIFTIERDAAADYVLTSAELAQEGLPLRKVNLPLRHDESELLRSEMEIMGHDLFFEQALQEVEMLLGK